MSGHAEPGRRGFFPKEGVAFAAELKVRLHPDELDQIDALRAQESRSDWVRAAIREKLLRDARVEREREMDRRLAPFYAEQENGR